MMTIGNYSLASTRGKTALLHVCRVRRHGLELVAEVFPGKLDPDRKGHSDPLKFVRQFPQSFSRKEFVRQLLENNVSMEDVQMILTAQPESGPKLKKPRKASQ